ncbi:MAG: hypothetical protein OXL33_08260, partial [Chloroflexota bacterium]|nr:hypothetical protein [Chloroflexota bacterium]
MASNRQLDPIALARILRAELEDGCRDKRVTGGLGALLQGQLSGPQATVLAPLVDYGRLSQ